jgi:YidC/Oxa1 family membrane protein insertase
MNKTDGFRQFSQMQGERKPGKSMGFLGWILLALCAYYIFMPAKKEQPAANLIAEIDQVDVSAVPRTTLSDSKITATIQGIRISNINLNEYKAERGEPDNIELLSDDKEFVEVGFFASETSAPKATTVWKTPRSATGNTMFWKSDSGVEFRRVLSSSDDYVITASDEIRNNGKKPVLVSQYSRIVRNGGAGSRFAVKTGGVSAVAGDVETESWDDLESKSASYDARENQSSFAGFSDQYWQVVVSSGQPSDKTIKLKQRADKLFQADVAPEYMKIEAGKTASFKTEIFAGPKTQGALRAAAVKIPDVDRTIDYGTFGFLSRPFLWMLNRLHDAIPNYGVAIILLTLIIRGLMWPLTKKSYKSTQAMQKIQPEMQRIQKLYGGDKMRLQQEIMNLYRTHKANPMGSIGIMLLQIPLFFALYKALLIAVPLRHAGFLWLSDLSVKDPYFILPVLMAAMMWLQNRLSHAGAGDAPGAKVMKYMPFVFAVMFAWMPSGLVLYWTVSSAVGIIQMAIMKKEGK